ncbi:TIGR00645 family protein [Acetobacteraceae bacterium AT-5844]|nr:TIGR00645 family protein [Acetobacteraceae bacterium AT-5844]
MIPLIDKAMLAARHILSVFFLGLMVGLLLYAVRFLSKLWEFATQLFVLPENDDLLTLLHLADSALVASMVAMVAISSYDSLVSRLKEEAAAERMHWVGGLDTGNLKLKLATSIVAISSIQLLQIFLKPGSYDDRETMWALVIHGTFLAGALVLGVLERLGRHEESSHPVAEEKKEVHNPASKEARQEKE